MTRNAAAGAWSLTALAVLAAFVATAGSCETATQDRQQGGNKADEYMDVTEVVVWRNIDNAPNVVGFCAEGVRLLATLSLDGARSPALVVAPDFAQTCGGAR